VRSLAPKLIGGAVAATLLWAPASALAVGDCDRQPAQRVLVSGLGTLESVIADDRGHLFFTDADAGRLLRMNRRHDEPRILVDGIRAPGGLAFLPDGSLLVGFGDAIATAVNGEQDPQAGLIRVDPRTGENHVYAEELAMANGVTPGPDGAIYTSADVGTAGIDRVLDGEVTRSWARIESPNGLVVDTRGEWLYAAQTFVPAAISRIELADPTHVEAWFRAPPADFAAGLDGMVRDDHDRLYVAANGGGAIWRVDADGAGACALARMPPLGPSAVAFGTATQGHNGRPIGFGRRNLYVTTFQGELIQLKDVRGRRGRP
jgi:sugar lactone lactonase YvrE